MGSLDTLRDRLRNDPPVVTLFEVGDLISARLPSGRDEVKGTIGQISELPPDGLCAFIHVCDEDSEKFKEPDWKLWVSLRKAAFLARPRNGLKLTFEESITMDDLKNMGERAHGFLGWPEGSRIQITTSLRASENLAWMITPGDDVYECKFEASGVFMSITMPHREGAELFGTEVRVANELLKNADRILLLTRDWADLAKQIGWPESTTVVADRDVQTNRIHLVIAANLGQGRVYGLHGTWNNDDDDDDDRAFIFPHYKAAFPNV